MEKPQVRIMDRTATASIKEIEILKYVVAGHGRCPYQIIIIITIWGGLIFP